MGIVAEEIDQGITLNPSSLPPPFTLVLSLSDMKSLQRKSTLYDVLLLLTNPGGCS